MSAGIRRQAQAVYLHCMVCRFEHVVSCKVQSTYVTSTLEVNVSPLNILSDCSLREEVKRKFCKSVANLHDVCYLFFLYYPHMRTYRIIFFSIFYCM